MIIRLIGKAHKKQTKLAASIPYQLTCPAIALAATADHLSIINPRNFLFFMTGVEFIATNPPKLLSAATKVKFCDMRSPYVPSSECVLTVASLVKNASRFRESI